MAGRAVLFAAVLGLASAASFEVRKDKKTATTCFSRDDRGRVAACLIRKDGRGAQCAARGLLRGKERLPLSLPKRSARSVCPASLAEGEGGLSTDRSMPARLGWSKKASAPFKDSGIKGSFSNGICGEAVGYFL